MDVQLIHWTHLQHKCWRMPDSRASIPVRRRFSASRLLSPNNTWNSPTSFDVDASGHSINVRTSPTCVLDNRCMNLNAPVPVTVRGFSSTSGLAVYSSYYYYYRPLGASSGQSTRRPRRSVQWREEQSFCCSGEAPTSKLSCLEALHACCMRANLSSRAEPKASARRRRGMKRHDTFRCDAPFDSIDPIDRPNS